MRNLAFVLLSLLVMTIPFAHGQEAKLGEGPARARKVSPHFAKAPGWELVTTPLDFELGRKWGTASEKFLFTGYSVVDADGVLRIFAVLVAPDVHRGLHRLVVFDVDGNRYRPKSESSGGLGNRDGQLDNGLYSLDPKTLAPDKVAYLGMEKAAVADQP